VDAGVEKRLREPVRTLVEVAVSDLAITVTECDGAGALRGDLAHDVADAKIVAALRVDGGARQTFSASPAAAIARYDSSTACARIIRSRSSPDWSRT
jgi:hypothetical protein